MYCRSVRQFQVLEYDVQYIGPTEGENDEPVGPVGPFPPTVQQRYGRYEAGRTLHLTCNQSAELRASGGGFYAISLSDVFRLSNITINFAQTIKQSSTLIKNKFRWTFMNNHITHLAFSYNVQVQLVRWFRIHTHSLIILDFHNGLHKK